MKNIFYLPLTLLTLFACQTKKQAVSTPSPGAETNVEGKSQDFLMQKQKQGITFFATGTEPFWALDIDTTKNIIFTQLDKPIVTVPYVKPEAAMDANIRRYRVNTDALELIVTLTGDSCQNAMSGEKSPYRVEISLKKNTDTNPATFKGCGRFIPDFRLHDIWTIETINGKSVADIDYSRNRPYLELDMNKGSYQGNTGCNGISGTVNNEANVISFSRGISTMIACPGDLEQRFNKALASSKTYYIKNNTLYLLSREGAVTTFRKTD